MPPVKQFMGRVGASEKVLADGSVIVLGKAFDLDDDALKDPHNKRLIDERQIVEVKTKKGGDSS